MTRPKWYFGASFEAEGQGEKEARRPNKSVGTLTWQNPEKLAGGCLLYRLGPVDFDEHSAGKN